MTFKEYYLSGGKVFNTSLTYDLFTITELTFMNNMVLQLYKNLELDEDSTTTSMDILVGSIINKNKPYYQGIKDSYATIFDTLKRTKIVDSMVVDKTVALDTNDTKNYNTVNETKNTGSNTKVTNQETIDSERNGYTLNKNYTNTVNDKKNTYDNGTLTIVGENITTDVGSDINTGTVSKNGSLDNTVRDTLNTTNNTTNTGTDKSIINSDTSENVVSSNDKQGYDNIDFEKAISEIYTTRKINLYDIVISNVVSLISIPIYHIDEDIEY